MPEMPKNKKIVEMMKILSYIYSQSKTVEVSPLLAQMWIEQVSGFSVKQCWRAAKELFKTTTYGEPKFADFWEILKTQNARTSYNPWAQEQPKIERAADVLARIGTDQKLLEAKT